MLVQNRQFTVSDITIFNKIAFLYKSGQISLFINGTEFFTNTSTFSNLSLNTLQFDGGSGLDDFYGKIKGLAVYNEALTDAQLIELTS